jgi:hypothetical protein
MLPKPSGSMSTNDPILDFAASLNREVREQASEGSPHSTEIECFASRVLELFEEAGVVEEPEVCVRAGRLGRRDWEIAGWAFPPSDDEDLSELSILAVHVLDSPEPLAVSGTDLRRRFELAVHFVREMLEGRADDLEPASDAAALGRIVYERRKSLNRIVVHLATDGLTQRLREIDSERVGHIEIVCSIWDIERLSRLGDPTQAEIDVDVRALLSGKALPCLRVPEEDPDYDAYLCVVPGTLLFKVYDKYGQRLLEQNVRAFLSSAGKVNKGIRETIQTRPERFFPYNNGLALTARSVEIEKNEAGHDEIVRIVGLQIVNGGQTTASIHRAWKLDRVPENVEKIFVQGKLVVITTKDDEEDKFTELVRSISKFANSQNAVKNDDLEANQPWHVAFEKLSRDVWAPDRQSQWYYERARGSYSTAKMRLADTRARLIEFERRWPRSQLITKTDLAKSLNAWSQHPEVVSLGGQKNFLHFMRALDVQVLQPKLDEQQYRHIVAHVILFRGTAKIVNRLKEAIPAYRAQVVAYLVAYLSLRMPHGLDFDTIWEKQALPAGVVEALQLWAESIYNCIIVSADGRNVGEWCKKSDCWAAVSRLDLKAPEVLHRSAARDGRGVRREAVEVHDAQEIAECVRIRADDWEQVLRWLVRRRAPTWQQGIVQTMKLYSMDGWTRRPSPKQAMHAARAARKWREATDEGGGAA